MKTNASSKRETSLNGIRNIIRLPTKIDYSQSTTRWESTHRLKAKQHTKQTHPSQNYSQHERLNTRKRQQRKAHLADFLTLGLLLGLALLALLGRCIR